MACNKIKQGIKGRGMEKRRYRRVALDIPVTIRYKGNLMPALALNVSSGGMYIKANTENEVIDGPIEVSFDLDKDNKDLSLSGNVARVEKSDSIYIGVQFKNPFSSSYKTLREFLTKNY